MLSNDAARTKGIGFMNVRTFAEEHFGEHAWHDLVQTFPHVDRDELNAVVPVGWYSLALYARLIHTLDTQLGSGDLSVIETLGAYEAQRDLTTVHRVFLRMANPAFIVEQIAKLWMRFHDTGVWEVQRHDPHHASGRLRDWGIVDRAMCTELVAYMQRSLELVGAQRVVVEHTRCRVDGSDACYFDARWS